MNVLLLSMPDYFEHMPTVAIRHAQRCADLASRKCGLIPPSCCGGSGPQLSAMEKSPLWGDEIPIGKFVECTDVPTLHGAEPALNIGPLVYSEARIPRDVARSIVEALM